MSRRKNKVTSLSALMLQHSRHLKSFQKVRGMEGVLESTPQTSGVWQDGPACQLISRQASSHGGRGCIQHVWGDLCGATADAAKAQTCNADPRCKSTKELRTSDAADPAATCKLLQTATAGLHGCSVTHLARRMTIASSWQHPKLHCIASLAVLHGKVSVPSPPQHMASVPNFRGKIRFRCRHAQCLGWALQIVTSTALSCQEMYEDGCRYQQASPGKMKELLAWLGTTSRPSPAVNGWKAVPLPKATRSWQAWKASSAVHSALSVGLDRASTIGTFPPTSL